MTIDADGYYWVYSQFTPPKNKRGTGTFTALSAVAGSWTGPSKGSAALGSKDAAHAERTAYAAMESSVGKSKAFYLFVQNAFPCGKCLEFYESQAAHSYFIFVISEDQGSYSMDNGLDKYTIAYPQILYIQGGRRWYPGYVSFWTHGRDTSGNRTNEIQRALRSCSDPSIKFPGGAVKKPQSWPDFPSIAAYL